MPLKRTPPKIISPSKQDVDDSEPNSASTEYEVNTSNLNVTRRPKRKREDDLSAFKQEFTQMFNDFKNEQNKKFASLQDSITTISKQNEVIRETIDFISAKYDDMVKRMNELENERKVNYTYIVQLENKVEYFERQQKIASVEVRNVPQKLKENKQDLSEIITNTGKALNIPVTESDIRDIYRTPTKWESNKPIVVEFTSVLLKDTLLRAIKKHNSANKDNKFNTSHMKIDGPKQPVYFAENLTLKAKRLFYEARNFAKMYNYIFCWTSNGKVFLRKSEGQPHILVKCEEDLTKLKASQP